MPTKATLLSVAFVTFVFANGIATSATSQPAPPSPGVAAPELEAEYRAVQFNAQTSEEARIKATVDIYFRLKYESILQLQAFDPGFLIDTATESGRDLYNYEMGRYEYNVAGWRRNKLSIQKYEYSPEYSSVKVEGTKALVEICPWAEIWSSRTYRTGAETHVVSLALTKEGWKLVDDSYADEFTQYYPRGTDFGKEIAALENAESDTAPIGPPMAVALGVGVVGAVAIGALLLRRRRLGL